MNNTTTKSGGFRLGKSKNSLISEEEKLDENGDIDIEKIIKKLDELGKKKRKIKEIMKQKIHN